MRSKSMMLTAATAIGITALAASTAARATTWVAVPDDSDYVAQQTYVYDRYDSGPAYAAPAYVERDYAPAPRIPAPRTVVTRERTYSEPTSVETRETPRVADPAYAAPGYVRAGFSDSCYVRREPGLFGGWHEYRDCP